MKKNSNDHRIKVTLTLIRRAFMQLLSKKPVHSISVKELCETAKINRGTFYSHYTDIYDLKNQIEDDMLEELKDALAPLLSKNERILPTDITAGIFECLKNNSDLCTATLGEYGDKQFLLRLLDIGRLYCLESYSKYFENASAKKIEYFYSFISNGCIGLLSQWFSEGMTVTANEMAAMTKNIIAKGIGFLE